MEKLCFEFSFEYNAMKFTLEGFCHDIYDC
jgi:hypothetical protein